MVVKRNHGVISGSAGIEADLIDTMGGGLCEKHGKFYGNGKHGLRACPFCDIDEYFKKRKKMLKELEKKNEKINIKII